jgi:hypothetical protein
LHASAPVFTVETMSPVNRALVGAVAWIGFVFVRMSDLRDDGGSHALLLFAALVLVPLALELFADDDESPVAAKLFSWVRLGQLPAALLLGVACWLPAGTGAALATLPWVAITWMLASLGFSRLRREGMRRDFDRLCADVALVFSLVGGLWTLADRSGLKPLGFDPAVVALTAVHFHYAGLLLPLFAGLLQRELFFWRLASRAAVGVILGVPAVAMGITFTQLGWGTSFEKAATCGLALAGMAVGILHVRLAVDGRQPWLTRSLVGLAGFALFLAMALAVVYALRSTVTLVPWLDLPRMRLLHGIVTAFGFGLGGVLAWRRLEHERRAAESTVDDDA